MRERKVKRDELLEAIWSHGNWNNTGDNEAAKDALIKFLAKLKKRKPNDVFCVGYGIQYTKHYPYLLQIRKALQKHYYERANNEVISLLHYTCQHTVKNKSKVYIPRHIYINLMGLLQEHFSNT